MNVLLRYLLRNRCTGGILNSAEGVTVKEFIIELITLELPQEGQIEVIQDFIPSF